MNRIIIISLLFFANNAFATIKPKVYIGGKANIGSAMVDQSADYSQDNLPNQPTSGVNKNKLNQDNYFAQEAEIDVVAIGKTDNGILYGSQATVELDSQMPRTISYDSTNKITYGDTTNSIYTRRLYMFLEKKAVGRLEFGDVESAATKMKFDASYRFGGAGGISGSWWQYVNIPNFALQYDNNIADGLDCTGSYATNDVRYCGDSGNAAKGNMSFIIRPDLPLAHGYSVANGADKFDDTRTIGRVSYFSPRISGVQVGVSYALDSGYRGSSYYDNNISPRDSADVKDVIDAGINYVGQFDKIGLGLSLTGEKGYAKSTNIVNNDKFLQQDLSAYAAGFYMFIGNLSLSGSYGSWENSLMWVRSGLTATNNKYRKDAAHYYTAGALYEFGPYKFGIAHLASEYREQSFALTSYAFDYRFNKKLSIYAEFDNYEFETKNTDIGAASGKTYNNSGQVILVGAKLKFGGTNNLSQFVLDTSQNNY